MTDSYSVPKGLLYTREHEWTRVEGSAALVGITDYAAKTLNDVVYLSLPSPGERLKQLTTFGTIESIKAVSELYSPLSGTVRKVNSELVNHPELVNQSPYTDGWILEIEVSNLTAEKTTLLTSDQYEGFLTSLEK